MEEEGKTTSFHHERILDVIKKAFEQGEKEEMTMQRLMEDLKIDLESAITE